MDLKKVLTETEYGSLSEDIVTKIESAYRTELASAVEIETKKTNARFNKMLESVSAKADEKIQKAVMENVGKMKETAMSDKMYKVLQAVAAVLESAGIPTSEVTKKLKEELALCNVNLQKAYAEREHVKAQLNEQQKKNYIYKEVQGMRPEIVDAVMQHFIHRDVREIDRDSILKFINGQSNDVYMMDVDPDAGGDLNLDRVNAALDEIDRELELDVPTLPSMNSKTKTEHIGDRPSRFESLGKGLKPERVATSTPNVTFESLANMNIASEDESMDDDVADALRQMNDLGKFV